MVDLAENSYIFAYDLHATGAGGNRFSFRVDGRGSRLSTGRDVRRSIGGGFLWGGWIAAAHEVAAFSSDAFDVDILIWLRLDEFRRHLQDIGVEGAGQALISGNKNQQDVGFRPLGEQRMARISGERIVDIGA